MGPDIKIIKVLGTGSFGTVYKIQNRDDGFECAVKVTTAINEYNKEGHMLDKINDLINKGKASDRSAVKELGRYCINGRCYIFMELANMTLQEYIEKNPYINEYGIDEGFLTDQVLSFAYQLLEAVYSLHINDIIHGDIKPANILLFKGEGDNKYRYTLKLSDFGLSCYHNSPIARCQKTGSPLYMDNTLIRDRNAKVTKESDLYSVGAVLFNMFTEGMHFTWTVPSLIYSSPMLGIYTETYRSKAISNIQGNLKKGFGKYENDISAVIKAFLDPKPENRSTKMMEKAINKIYWTWKPHKRNEYAPILTKLSSNHTRTYRTTTQSPASAITTHASARTTHASRRTHSPVKPTTHASTHWLNNNQVQYNQFPGQQIYSPVQPTTQRLASARLYNNFMTPPMIG